MQNLRDRIALPLAIAVCLLWLASGAVALYTRDAQVFLVASGPFSLVCGSVFGVSLVRRAENGSNPRV